jgi:hypothetical protein
MLEANDRLRYVLWLDDDMIAMGAHVAFLRRCVDATSQACTAYYCKRGHPNELAMRAVSEVPPKLVSVMFCNDQVLTFSAHAVLCGMGFLMLSRQHFVLHCEVSPVVGAGDSTVPVVCTSGPVEVTTAETMLSASAPSLTWFSEDISYCDGLWNLCNGVVAVPIAVAHLSTIALLPAPDAAWLA